MYADDTQLYMPCTAEDSEGTVSKMEDSIADVKKWMSCNCLKLNDSKTEFLVISKRLQKKKSNMLIPSKSVTPLLMSLVRPKISDVLSTPQSQWKIM